MRDGDSRTIVRAIPRGTNEYRIALHRVLGEPVPASADGWSGQARELIGRENGGLVRLDMLFGAYRGDALAAICLGAELPGRSALVFASNCIPGEHDLQATTHAIDSVVSAGGGRSLRLLEALVSTSERALERPLHQAGFRFLTTLRYFQASPACRRGLQGIPAGLEWISYSPGTERLFLDALDRSYAQSQDCPELRNVRRLEEILEGHRAVGTFDPSLWFVALGEGAPAGIVLLNRHDSGSLLEIVYMGVAQASRGQGVADALLFRAFQAAQRSDANVVALAMDERNTPARRLYARWGFREIGRRRAWIATPGSI